MLTPTKTEYWLAQLKGWSAGLAALGGLCNEVTPIASALPPNIGRNLAVIGAIVFGLSHLLDHVSDIINGKVGS